MSLKQHWERVYQEKEPTDVSWHQKDPAASLQLIEKYASAKDTPILDVGAGASLLVDRLVTQGYQDVTVLDISAAALEHAKSRLGEQAALAQWVECGVTEYAPRKTIGLWHDRAVFHFLTAPEDRVKYRDVLLRALEKGGYAIIATFALDGPEKCSGLPVERYDAQKITNTLGDGFAMLEHFLESHITPWDTEQKFHYFVLVRK